MAYITNADIEQRLGSDAYVQLGAPLPRSVGWAGVLSQGSDDTPPIQ